MEFIKGTMIGMIAGVCLGYLKEDMICDIVKSGKKEIRKMKKKFNF